MTQSRSKPDSISNWLDDILDGIGKRGSSFTDVDWISHNLYVSHDGGAPDDHRFLFKIGRAHV